MRSQRSAHPSMSENPDVCNKNPNKYSECPRTDSGERNHTKSIASDVTYDNGSSRINVEPLPCPSDDAARVPLCARTCARDT